MKTVINDELMPFDLPQNQSSIIKVLGVGGGGSNAVNFMCRQGIKDVDFVVCNTDAQALTNSPVPVKIQLGESLTEGRGAGNKPEIGKEAALENLDDIIKVLSSNTKMVFITAGMGGGTGTGAAPVIAKAAKELGILTVGIVTLPFRFEGKRRLNQAINGIKEIKQHVDSLLVIDNEKLSEISGGLAIRDAFSTADNVLTVAAKGIAEIITVHGLVNVDFADVQFVMTDSGVALMGSHTADGKDRAIDAIKSALTSPLLNNNNIKGATNILLNVTSGAEEVTMEEIKRINEYVQEAAGQNADLIWGNTFDENLQGELTVTIIATGFSDDIIPGFTMEDSTNNNSKSTKLTETDKAALDKEIKDIDNINIEKEDEKPAVEYNLDPENDDIKEVNTKSEDKETKKKEQEIIPKSVYNKQLSNLERQNLSQRKPRQNAGTLKFHPEKYKNSIEEIENEPAYLRGKIDIDELIFDESADLSRYEISDKWNYDEMLINNSRTIHEHYD